MNFGGADDGSPVPMPQAPADLIGLICLVLGVLVGLLTALAIAIYMRLSGSTGAPLSLLVTDSQRFNGGGSGFTEGLLAPLPPARREAAAAAFEWESIHLERFTGSGILIEEDQTYDVDAKYISRWPAATELFEGCGEGE